MKILGIDYGSKRIGLAVSDESLTLARELGVFSPKDFFITLPKVIADNDISLIVVGLPLNMSGGDSETTKTAREFASKVKELSGKEIILVDERLSSSMASNLPGGNKDIDSLAAQIILQNYLDSQKN